MRDPVFAETLLRWYAENGRDLPWRRTRNPYAVWLSEIILQQTRIAQGTAYWERFMARFPTVDALAAAPEDEVMRLWQGLGYYSRARNLHAAAKQIVALGGFPSTLEGIRSLKGVGDYTAAAIGSIAFDLPAAVVDGNVYRVLARCFGIATPIGTTAGKHEFTALAQSLLPEDQAAAFNQAMMDFGAMVCTPASPSCDACPLAPRCDALRTGRVGLLPVKKAPVPVRVRYFDYIYVRCGGFTAIRRRGPGDIWQGLWEPLAFERPTEHPAEERRPGGDVVADMHPCRCEKTPGARLLRSGVRHQLTHRLLVADFWLWEPAVRPSLPDGYIWIPESDLDLYGKPRLFELLLAEV